MSLIIGIKCKDGVVLGADSAATISTSTGQPTSMQPVDKLDIINDTIILGVSGPVGLAQLFKAEIEKLWEEKGLLGKQISDAMVILSDALRKHLSREFKFAGLAKRAMGNLILREIFTQSLIALPIKKIPYLIEFTKQGSPEEKDEKLPTVAIGIAQQIVDPFLGFLRRMFWPERLPNLAEGKLAAYWALDYGIKSAPAHVAGPIRLCTLEKRGNTWQAQKLAGKEEEEILEFIDDIERHIKDYTKGHKPSKKDIKPPEP